VSQSIRRCWQSLVGVLLLLGSSVAVAASPYFITVTGTPSSITCTNNPAALPPPGTSAFAFGVGAQLSWNFSSAPTNVAIDFTVNGNSVASTPAYAIPSTTGGLALGLAAPTSFPLVAFPYAVVFRAIPAAPGADGMEVRFNCVAPGIGTGYAVVTIPAPPPILQATPSAVALPSTDYGMTSAPTIVTLNNTGTTASGVSFANNNPGEFVVSNNTCTPTIAQGGSCTFGVAFKPFATGARSGSLTISHAGGPLVMIPLSGTGTGTVPPGVLSFATSSNFAAQTVGSTSAANTITVTNTGGTLVNVASVVSSNAAEFPVTTTCTLVLSASTCTVGITFTPAAAGARSGTVTVTSNGVGSPQTIQVSGTGTSAGTPGQLTLAGSVVFGTQTLGTTSTASNVTVTNTGGAPVTVSGITSSAPVEFAVTNTGCTTVIAGAACTVSVTFAPAAAGARTATITLVSNGVGSPQVINLSGTGSSVATPGQLELTGNLSFGTRTVGTTSPPSTITVSNIGGAAVNVASVSSSNAAEFAVASTCGVVGPGASCTVSVTFAPLVVGFRAAAISVTSDGAGSPNTVNASGDGVLAPGVTVDLIEYHHAEWDHYFMTSIPNEIVKLDNGTFVGWARTGRSFKSYPLNTAGSNNVCRFFSTSFDPRSSHFYTPYAEECTKVNANPDWLLEGEVFGIPIPSRDGTCIAGTVPVYRLYNDGQGAAPNHRYTTDLAIRALMITRGWKSEGYGDIGVNMCAPA